MDYKQLCYYFKYFFWQNVKFSVYNQIKNINDLIKIFFENYNSFNIFIENFSLNKELKEFIEKNVNNGKNILISLENDSMVNYLLTDNIFKDISFFY